MLNGLRLKYCPKRSHFSYKGMMMRNMLVVMDHNENVGREQAKTLKGKSYQISSMNQVHRNLSIRFHPYVSVLLIIFYEVFDAMDLILFICHMD